MDRDLVSYFIEKTDERFDKLETKLDQIIRFKWQIIGGSLVASFVITALFNITMLLLRTR